MIEGCATQLSPSALNPLPRPAARIRAALDLNALVKDTPSSAETVQMDLDKNYLTVLGICQGVLSGYESQAAWMRWGSFTIAMVGTVAGAVVVPALSAATTINKVAVAAVGGLAGAANSAQNALNTLGLTAADVLATRTSIQQQFMSALNDYFKYRPANDYNNAETALERAQAACVAYAVATGGVAAPSP